MRHRRVLTAIAISLSIVFLDAARGRSEQASTAAATEAMLLQFLKQLGYAPEPVKSVQGGVIYRVTLTPSGWKIPVTVASSVNGEYVWVSCLVCQQESVQRLPSDTILEILARNERYGPAYFTAEDRGVYLQLPVEARAIIGAASLKGLFNQVSVAVQETQPLCSLSPGAATTTAPPAGARPGVVLTPAQRSAVRNAAQLGLAVQRWGSLMDSTIWTIPTEPVLAATEIELELRAGGLGVPLQPKPSVSRRGVAAGAAARLGAGLDIQAKWESQIASAIGKDLVAYDGYEFGRYVGATWCRLHELAVHSSMGLDTRPLVKSVKTFAELALDVSDGPITGSVIPASLKVELRQIVREIDSTVQPAAWMSLATRLLFWCEKLDKALAGPGMP
jgi:hypothetical protein